MAELSGKDGVMWAIAYFKQKGLRLQPSDEHNMVVAWDSHIRELLLAAEEVEEVKPAVKETGSLKGGRFKGLLTGDE